MGIYFYFGEKNIFKNQQNEHPDTGQNILGNDEGQRSVFKKICHHRIKLSGASLNYNQSLHRVQYTQYQDGCDG